VLVHNAYTLVLLKQGGRWRIKHVHESCCEASTWAEAPTDRGAMRNQATGSITAGADRTREVLAAWRTNNRATVYLIERLPKEIWSSPVPDVPRLTVRTLAAHIHNARCRWIKSLGARHGIFAPQFMDLRRVRQAELVRALARSSRGIVRLIELGASRGGRVPRATWQNFPTDLEHFLCYFVAHEAHHRGQLAIVCRQLGRRLPTAVASGIWQWTRLARE
jgi:uncharacterized damage-inducible protein DinB